MKLKTLLASVLILFSLHVHAAGGLYSIEILIFSQNMPNTEVFDQTESKIAWPRRMIPGASLERLGSDSMKLYGSYSKLARGQNYQPLLHRAWIQAVKENSVSDGVRIRGGNGTINGFFRLQRGSLIHMIADIEYSPESSTIFRLNEKRRFKLNEVHYLDHPKFGILVRVSPIKN